MEINKDVHYILNRINENGYEAYLVGGAVRNLLLGLPVRDYDITTNAHPETIMSIFERTIPTGIDYGTVTVIVGSTFYEITTYRMDYEYVDSRRPSVVHFSTDLEEDLTRRDFTINAVCMDKEGNIVDPLNGVDDIKKKVIRAIGDPELRFREDALRMLRAIRFMSELGFDIEDSTVDSMRMNSSKIKYISPERIQNELNRILLSQVPSMGFYKMLHTNILEQLLPEIMPCVGFQQHSSYHDKDVFDHTMAVLDNTAPKTAIRLAALFHDITKPYCLTMDENDEGHFYGHHIESAELSRKILTRLKYSNEIIDKVWKLIRYHPLKEINIGDKGVKKYINKVGKENLDDMFNLNYADIIGKSNRKGLAKLKNMEEKTMAILGRKDPLSLKDLEITGYDLKTIGVNEGPLVGQILDRLLTIVLDFPSENSKDKLLNHALHILKGDLDI
ncbi:tRNA nucleotidyltransferase (CCA-adding enzyme) [Dethiosulfatibacter aminovorans DSM 17477]|uniref:tRNA nucleotidyltransferase (CCA-adding enzyme) n=1 Tax=Dethiosulfatibacter aminovorans DSM 17477 TaxID=1121476 RepID=A0A1M6M934_9FIRM|nr:CCA tRNA nucleotidyltransferase [Dethiosulfatibacter aminovorans]SHJ79934.1 tRNA nucleotidyltransferase (CCA-adding enzyme) [Dethiosulfatibacter aminovorans DSM 17477]